MIKDILSEIMMGIYNRYGDLCNHYYKIILSRPYFNNATEEEKQAAKNYVDFIIVRYFKNNIKSNFTNYISDNITRYINRKIKENDPFKGSKKRINDLENYYTKIIYDNISIVTNVLTDEQKMMLSKKLYLKFYNGYKNCDNNCYLSSYIKTRINLMFNNKRKSMLEEKILLMYIFYFGMTDNIHEFLFYKYKEIAKSLKVSCNVDDFDLFIKEFIQRENYLFYSLCKSMEENLKPQNKNVKTSPKKDDEKDKFISYYSYIKDDIYKKYESEFNDKEFLKKLIEIKFEKIVDSYFLGEHKSHFTKYVFTYLNDYLIKFVSKKDKINDIIANYTSNCTSKMKDMIEAKANNAFYDFYIYNNANFENKHFCVYLKKELESMLYQDDEDINLSYKKNEKASVLK